MAQSSDEWDFQPPVFLGGFFGKDPDSAESEPEADADGKEAVLCKQQYETRSHNFPLGQKVLIRELSFHYMTANFVWPGARHLAGWLSEGDRLDRYVRGKRILELAAATGCLSIWLRKVGADDVTTSDYNDGEISENLLHNFRANGFTEGVVHVPHTWGEKLHVWDHVAERPYDVILASDIMNFERGFPGLVQTFCRLFVPREPLAASPPSSSSSSSSASPALPSSLPASTPASLASGAEEVKSAAPPLSGAVPPSSSPCQDGDGAGGGGGERGGQQQPRKQKKQKEGRGAAASASCPASCVESAEAVDAAGPYRTVFLMSWQRRHKHRPEEDFFRRLLAAGSEQEREAAAAGRTVGGRFRITTRGNRIYEIYREGC